jgi:transcription initiation factor TFIID subunit 7
VSACLAQASSSSIYLLSPLKSSTTTSLSFTKSTQKKYNQPETKPNERKTEKTFFPKQQNQTKPNKRKQKRQYFPISNNNNNNNNTNMSSQRPPIRDRTLILRILVPGLETGLRDKMREMEERAMENSKLARSTPASSNTNNNNNTNHSTLAENNNNNNSNQAAGATATTVKEISLDLEGVTCEPTRDGGGDGSTLWNFHCDGATYPARLVNLPCPIELHKTHDHAMYYKCCDVAQMLIVYEDLMALDEADSYPSNNNSFPNTTTTSSINNNNNSNSNKTEGYPSYYHSGITPPLKHVVQRRFALREHSALAPPRAQVSDVEEELHVLMGQISKETTKGGGGGGGGGGSGGGGNSKRNKVPLLASAQHANKILEEVHEEMVAYEPWMDDYGRQPRGIEFDSDDPLCAQHPELWLNAELIHEIQQEEKDRLRRLEQEAAEAERLAEEKVVSKKKRDAAAAAATAAAAAASFSSSSSLTTTATTTGTTKKSSKKKKKKEDASLLPSSSSSAMGLGSPTGSGKKKGLAKKTKKEKEAAAEAAVAALDDDGEVGQSEDMVTEMALSMLAGNAEDDVDFGFDLDLDLDDDMDYEGA